MTRIKRYTIRNLLGIESVQGEPGKVTLIQGKTGTGKTSILEGLMVALTNKGWRPRLVREGEDEAMLMVELDDGKTVMRTVHDDDPGRLVVKEDGVTLQRPQALLNALFGEFAFNPADFIQASPKEQANLLLSLVEMELSKGNWMELCGGEVLPGIDYTDRPLQVLADIERVLYEKRTGVNTEAKTLRTYASELQEAIPEDFDPEAIRGKELREVYDNLTETRHHNNTIAENEARLDTIDRGINDLKKKLKELMQTRQQLKEELTSLGDRIDLEPFEEEVRTFEEQQKFLHKLDDTEEATRSAEEAEVQSEDLTGLIEAVRAKPAELIAEAELPVEGMGIEDGQITINGRPIKSLSSGEQVQLALQVARATSGELQVLFVDGLEKLDSEAQEELRKAAMEDGFQYFVTEVADTELTIGAWEEDEDGA